jgi:integrase
VQSNENRDAGERVRPTPRQRRALALRLGHGTLSLVPHVRRLAASFLGTSAGAPCLEAVALRAVIGTIVWSGLTLPSLCEALSGLRRHQLQFDHGVLLLARTGFPTQRFHLDPRSLVLWGWVLLLRAQEPDWKEVDPPVLPARWRDPRRLRAGVEKIIATAGSRSWTVFNSAVQQLLACDGVPPFVIWRRSGQLFVTPEPTVGSSGVPVPTVNCVAENGRKPANRLAIATSASASPPWRPPVKQILRGLRRPGSRHFRQRMAADLETLFHDVRWVQEAGIIGQLYCRWVIVLLRSQLRQNSIRAYTARVGRILDAAVVSDPIMASASPADVIACVRCGVELYHTHESRRSALRALHLFFVFAAADGYPHNRMVTWHRIARTIGGAARAEPLLSPAEIRAAATTLGRIEPEGIALAVTVVLAGCGGLRRAELCCLTLDDVQPVSNWTIRIRRSKTKAGARQVPLGTLAPSWALDILETYHAFRATLATTSKTWLVTGSGAALDPDVIGGRIARVLRAVTGKPAGFHSLRRACATWLLVCWISIDRGWESHPDLPADGPFAAGVRAVLGNDPSIALWSLARLLGHVTPIVTVERYVLALDWIEAHVFAGEGRIASRMAAEMLAVTERHARNLVECHKGSATVDALLTAQRRRLRFLAGDDDTSRRSRVRPISQCTASAVPERRSGPC